MKKSDQFLFGKDDSHFSLSKLVGKKVTDVVGYPSDPFGGTALFKISQIVFEDGTKMWVEGEHDTPYLPANSDFKNMDEETLQEFIDEDSEDEEEDA